MGEGGRRPGEGRAADVEVFHRRDADDGGGVNSILTVRDGGDVKDGIRLGQGVVAGVVAERAFVAQRLGRVNVAFDDEVALPPFLSIAEVAPFCIILSKPHWP